ncbi:MULTISPECIES: FAD-dependent monooxygenase [Streptomyces]|uniref:FAD-dependent monooxygenase n=1 Tax=Streptomyces griseoaurantiacus TaxID=68213 RepID=UPI002E304E66|nr:FAD-dependent monooxygenase [Streptomyces jietaisiensis]
MADVDVLVVGAGPVGLTVAAELRRHGVDCRVIDRLAAPQPHAKAIGVLPRTLEVWDAMGLVGEVLDEAVPHLGQLVYTDGKPQDEPMRLTLPPDIPYPFATLPQYTTERLLTEHLARFGTRVERPVELREVTEHPEEVEVLLAGTDGRTERLRARYVVGCDGAHSLVREQAGLAFEGDVLPERFMIADVEIDWDMPAGYSVRSVHTGADGAVDDMLVCIPMPGVRRYWLSMLRPGEQAAEDGRGAPEVSDRSRPEPGAGEGLDLDQIQAVLDRLSPEPARVSALRWSSAFRTGHRLVDRYRAGRLLVAGDAAHVHPPIGGQGLNTGVQDAYNLAWKLALTVRGLAREDVLDSYHAERHPVAREVVDRTVRHARTVRDARPSAGGPGGDPHLFVRRQAQLLVGYPDSPLVRSRAAEGARADGPAPGERAPDCRGLLGDLAAYPVRLFDLLRTPRHVLLMYAGPRHVSGESAARLEACAAEAHRAAHGLLNAYLVTAREVPRDARPVGLRPPRLRDAEGGFHAAYAPRDGEAVLIRPDGYVSARFDPAAPEDLVAHLRRTFR